MDVLTIIEITGASMAAFGVFSTYRAAYNAGYRAGQKAKRTARKPREARPVLQADPTNVVQFKTAGEVGKALAEELAKRKPNADEVQRLANLQNSYRAAGRI